MNTLASGTLSSDMDKDDSSAEPEAKTTTSGGGQEIQWEVVVEAAGLAQAQIIAGRLQAEGIPAHAWQEGAGQAFGLTIGKLGTGYVVVPETYLEEAKEILASLDENPWYEDSFDQTMPDEDE